LKLLDLEFANSIAVAEGLPMMHDAAIKLYAHYSNTGHHHF
jgi:hypothetical protein